MNASDGKRPQFGNRFLTGDRNVFEHNAWDDVAWSEDLQRTAEEKIRLNSERLLSEEQEMEYDEKGYFFWDKFYGIHQNRFFKDRHWLFTEFPELLIKSHDSNNQVFSEPAVCTDTSESDEVLSSDVRAVSESQLRSSTVNILEVGCGVGNTVFPIVESNIDSNVMVYCCDFSEVAISLIKSNPSFDSTKCCPFVCDITAETWDVPFCNSSLDIIILIFVLSAVHPKRMQQVINKLTQYLKPGGTILFRDYGKYDMVELRFKPGRCLSDDFYVRGDGTYVYFFTEEEVHQLFTNAGLVKKQSKVDRRLQVNRGKLLTMYRVWVQAKYMKPILGAETCEDVQ